MKNHKIFVGLLLPAFLYIISMYTSCAMPTISRFAEDDPNVGEIFRTATTVSVAWVYGNAGAIESYKLYYKAHGDSTWILLNTITAAAPLFNVDHSSLGDGSWDFGVSAVDALGTESEIHSSLDMSADPDTGWYLLWAS